MSPPNTMFRVEPMDCYRSFVQVEDVGYKKSRRTEMRVRRVQRAGEPEEVQIELGIATFHQGTNRTSRQDCSFVMNAAQAAAFVEAVTTLFDALPDRAEYKARIARSREQMQARYGA